jgi:hypothetical protein
MSLSLLRRRGTAALAVVATLAAGTAAAAPAQAIDDGFWSVPYSPTLYLHEHTGSTASTTPVTYAFWASRSFPVPRPAPTQYVRYSWTPTLHAVTDFGESELWKTLDYAEWQHLGFPEPSITARHIPGTEYFQFPGVPEVFAGLDGVAHVLTYEEWAESGFQPPADTDFEVFKLSWRDEVVAVGVIDGEIGASILTLDEWQDLGSPQPWVMPMLPEDKVCLVAGTDDLRYDGVAYDGVLTYDQWQAAGFPIPRCEVDPIPAG